MTRTMTAVFDTRQEAEAAEARLREIGVEPGAVQITSKPGEGAAPSEPHHRSFLDGLKDIFMPDDDRQTYHEAVNRGGYLMTVRADDTLVDRVHQSLEQSGAVDFEAREAEMRSSGWTPNSAGTAERLRVADERLRVGKREVERGGVKVRSYVEETPVREQIGLREESVSVERNPVEQRLTGAEADAVFQDRSIELVERAEEAVVAKETVVSEEIALRKDVGERTETISDTVRHAKVEVDDSRAPHGGTMERADQSATTVGAENRSFTSGEHSLAMDPDGDAVAETEEERRQRLEHERSGRDSRPL